MIRAVLASAVLVLTVGGCDRHPATVAVTVDHPVAMVDAPVDVRVTGLAETATVTIRTQTRDYQGAQWRAESVYRAVHGTVDVAATAPVSGAYSGVDGMGPFWSMAPVAGDPGQARFGPPRGGYDVTVSAVVDGRTVASATVTRQTAAPGVHGTVLGVADAGFAGTYVAPPPSGALRPAVLTFGGSEGGVYTGVAQAEILAGHGFPALGIGYFKAPGLPDTLADVPLEYFAKALRWLRAQPGVDPHHVLIWGASRGGEAALLVAATFPDLVDGVVAAVPSSMVNGVPDAPPDSTASAWTLGGKPLPPAHLPLDPDAPDPATVIPVERIHGPVLTIGGGQDALWPSAWYCRQIADRLDAQGFRYPHQNLSYPDAGHGVGVLVPYVPAAGTTGLGGTRPANVRAMEDAWPKVLAFIARG